MANITAMPFRSVDGDRPVSATMDARRFAQYVTNGIDNISGADALKVEAVDGEFAVSVQPGGAVINGYSGWVDEGLTMPLSEPDTTHPRIDRVVFRVNLTIDVRYFELLILEGTPSENPTPPEITRNELIHDLVLADVYIPAGSLILQENAVTDMRGDPELCGRLAASGQKLIKGTAVPTPKTQANIGDAYIDTSEIPHAYYLCLGVDNGVYTWKRMGYMAKKLKTEIVTASTTWVVPVDIAKAEPVRVLVFGGGGGAKGGAGAGGGHMNQYVGELENTSYIITIGNGGTSSGGNGGVTSFGNLVSASGGNGVTGRVGGNGGTGGGGGTGSNSTSSDGGNGTYGGGGGSPFTNGGSGGTYGGGGGGGNNSEHGGGNGGSSVNYTGGSGSTKGNGGGGAGYSSNGQAATTSKGGDGGTGENTSSLNLDFTGQGNAGSGKSSTNGAGAGGGGGGYGGNGGAANPYGGGGGGYGANGGDGTNSGGGGGGGYGGNGKSGTGKGGGGGGGYGAANYGSGGNSGGNAGTAGVCVIQYYVYDLT